MSSSFFQRVYQITREIPSGKVATYGQIARLLNEPRKARAVGYALHANPDPKTIPCHRVVNRFGELAPNFAFQGPAEQKRRLEKEGIEVRDFKVDLDKNLLHSFTLESSISQVFSKSYLSFAKFNKSSGFTYFGIIFIT